MVVIPQPGFHSLDSNHPGLLSDHFTYHSLFSLKACCSFFYSFATWLLSFFFFFFHLVTFYSSFKSHPKSLFLRVSSSDSLTGNLGIHSTSSHHTLNSSIKALAVNFIQTVIILSIRIVSSTTKLSESSMIFLSHDIQAWLKSKIEI